MTEKERLQHIERELKATIKELTPMLNELFFLNECLKDLTGVCIGKDPEHI